MKITQQQVARNREALLDAAARLFRERGFAGVSVADITSAAGLTHGAFYGHFTSKETLFAAAIEAVVLPATPAWTADTMAQYASAYLSAGHRDNPGASCMYATLGSEAARSSDQARHALTQALRLRLDAFALTAPGADAAERHRSAVVGYAAMIGALLLARVVDDAALSDDILAQARDALAGPPP
jgi:TetR/AcrR family transcriptional repressor of nem operon